jgi:hypothetical protein
MRLPGWSAIAAGNLAWSMVLPAEFRSVTIAVDRDWPGENAAELAARRWRSEGRTVRFWTPNRVGADANDILGRQQSGR